MPAKPYNKYQAMFYGVRPCDQGRVSFVRASEYTLSERLRKLRALPRDLTGFLMGDPPVGFSALEQRQIASPSIVHDKLDDLVFGLRV